MSATRHLIILAIWAAVLPAAADVDVNALRQSNTSALQLRGLDRGLMVRDRELPISRDETTRLLLFCRQKGVTAIFVASYDLPPQAFFDRERIYRWQAMISEAHRQGLRVYASTGNVGWVNDRGRALAQLDAVAQLGAMGGPGAGFDGVLLEFPALARLSALLPAASSNQPQTDFGSGIRSGLPARGRPDEMGTTDERARGAGDSLFPAAPSFDPSQLGATSLEDRDLLRQHFEIIEDLKTYLTRRYASSRLQLGVSVPAWLQTPVSYGPEVKPALQHFIDLSDFTVLHNLPGETPAIAEVADHGLRYAGESGKSAFLRLELGFPPREEPQLISLFDYDEAFLETVVLDLLDRHGSTPGLAGVMLDDYRSYARLPVRREVPGLYFRPTTPAPETGFGSQPWRRVDERSR